MIAGLAAAVAELADEAIACSRRDGGTPDEAHERRINGIEQLKAAFLWTCAGARISDR